MSFVMLTESQLGPPSSSSHAGSGDRVAAAAAAAATGGYNGHGSEEGGRGGEGEERRTFADQVEKTERLFEIISSRSDIDHPICVECTELLVDGLQKRLVGATKERDAYIAFLRNLNASVPTAEEVGAAERTLQETQKEEQAAAAELGALEREKATLDEEIAALEEESRQLDGDEEAFWRDRNSFALTLADFQNERDALNMRYHHDSSQLERLQRTNVYNDAFCIGHDGYFGTINGLRLGRLTNPSVEWPEINAAWGQTALLLATIADKLNFTFQGYRVKPLGSTSRIEKLDYPPAAAATSSSSQASSTVLGDSAIPPPTASTTAAATATATPKITVLDLFSSGDLPLNLPWIHRRFDAGMVAFLECLRQLGDFVERMPPPTSRRGNQQQQQQQQMQPQQAMPGLKLPYAISRDRIGDASIKLGFNQNDETWTRACKYTLTCCKFLLAHVSNIASAGSSNHAAAAAAAAAGGVATGEQGRSPQLQ